MSEPAPYPPVPPGTKYREIPFPVESPERAEPGPMQAIRASNGQVVDILATIGARPRNKPPKSPDEVVGDWREVT